MRKIIELMAMMVLLIIGLSIVGYATVTCTFDQSATTVGTSSSYIRGATQLLNITLTGADINVNATTAIVSAGATGCTISGATTFNNTASNWTKANWTISTIAMRDDTACTFTAIVKNVSNQNTIATCTPIVYIADNTKPTSILTTPASGSKDVDGSIAFTYTCGNASSANLIVDTTSYTMTESSDVCTYTGTWATNGFHSHYITSSDGLNTTTSVTSTVEVRKPGGYIYDEQGEIMEGTSGAEVQTSGGNAIIRFINSIFNAIFGIFDTIFSVFKRG